MGSVEKLGMLKMDFLGLKTLTVIDNALRLIKESLDVDLDMAAISMSDPDTYKLTLRCSHSGCFSSWKVRACAIYLKDEAGLF